jgi:hypothetical protein
VEIMPPTAALFDQGLALFAERQDKAWSLPDCISFVVMQERGIREALSGDHHVEQAGFVALLRRGTDREAEQAIPLRTKLVSYRHIATIQPFGYGLELRRRSTWIEH